MIVTADPLSDYNATSQILRYSALAREVTVPRIPSTTSTIMSPTNEMPSFIAPSATRSEVMSGRSTPVASSAELHSLLEDVSVLRMQLELETQKRIEAEAALEATELKLEEVDRKSVV